MATLRKSMILIILTAFLLALAGYGYQQYNNRVETKEYQKTAPTLSPEEVLQKHFFFKQNKDEHLLKLTIAEKRSQTDFMLNNLLSLKILSIDEKGYDTIAQQYLSKNNSCFNATSFDVQFEVKYKKPLTMDDGIYTWRYVLIKEQQNSPWIIYNWGVNF